MVHLGNGKRLRVTGLKVWGEMGDQVWVARIQNQCLIPEARKESLGRVSSK